MFRTVSRVKQLPLFTSCLIKPHNQVLRQSISFIRQKRSYASNGVDVPNHDVPKTKPRNYKFYLALLAATAAAYGVTKYYLVRQGDKLYLVSDEGGIKKQKIVILGSGWAGLGMVQDLDTDLYDVVVISPRNYFLFTPLLPSVTVGTINVHSITEPIRKYCQRTKSHIKFYEASCVDIDPETKRIKCKQATGIEAPETFDLDYDYLVVAVGAVNNTFGTPGVYENCHFLKEIEDAKAIRRKVLDCFEAACLPHLPQQEVDRLLHFVVVGGGPNGVEFAAELHDFVKEDVSRWFPNLSSRVKITLVEAMDHILNTYDAKISEYTENHFKRSDIEVLANTMVTAVKPKEVCVKYKTLVPVQGKPQDESGSNLQTVTQEAAIPYGLCVWSTGIGANPIVSNVMQKLPEKQTNRRGILTDEKLRVLGAPNAFALGDCATVNQEKLLNRIADLFSEFDADKNGVLSPDEFRQFVQKSVHRYPQLETYLKKTEDLFAEGDINKDQVLSKEEFNEILKKVDTKIKALPATAQVASQQGTYLAKAFNTRARNMLLGKEQEEGVKPFRYSHFASFAYVGENRSVADFPEHITINGLTAWWLWRSVYLSKQVSLRNKVLVAFDWTRTALFGRDISKN